MPKPPFHQTSSSQEPLLSPSFELQAKPSSKHRAGIQRKRESTTAEDDKEHVEATSPTAAAKMRNASRELQLNDNTSIAKIVHVCRAVCGTIANHFLCGMVTYLLKHWQSDPYEKYELIYKFQNVYVVCYSTIAARSIYVWLWLTPLDSLSHLE